MGTIPASAFVKVTPGVIGAGGTGLAMIGLLLDNGTRVPVGDVLSFPSPTAVENYFGTSSAEAAAIAVYFNGFDNSNIKPGAVLLAQYNQGAVAAYLRSGAISALTLAELQALSGSLTLVMDGYSRTAASINLAAANSFSAAAALIQAGLNSALPTESSFPGSIAPETASFTGAIAGTILTVSVVASGELVDGEAITGTAGGVAAGTVVVEQLSGAPGGAGSYVVSPSQVVASSAMSGSYGLLTASAVASGLIEIGQTVGGTGVAAGTLVNQQLSGTAGGTGTYAVGPSQTAGSAAMTGAATAVAVAYDSVSGAFVVTSGITGAPSTAAFATGGIAAGLMLTQATGAVLSQGAAPAQPIPFMDGIVAQTQNWVSFATLFDPDGGGGNAQKLLFAQWTNDQGDRYLYPMRDFDITPTESAAATSSAGYIIKQNDYSGIAPIYEPSDLYGDIFLCGAVASVDFDQTNGRTTFAYRSQTGLTPGVTDETAYENLLANGYNCYAAVATAAQGFEFFTPGSVSGPFAWIDSYINQIWLNNALQLAALTFMTTVKSIPYNPAGYAALRTVLAGGASAPIQLPPASPVAAALNFGAIRPNVPLSAAEAAAVNSAAGVAIDGILGTQGWYLQILPATAQVRAARGSPPINLWYMDGQSVQQISLNSTEVE